MKMENSQIDDSVSSCDRVSHGHASSTDENKTCLQNLRDGDISTISSGQRTSIRSDLSSEAGQPFNKDRKDPHAGRGEEVNQGDPTSKVPICHEQLKTESSSFRKSGDVALQSLVDSTDQKHCQSTSSHEVSAKKKEPPAHSDITESELQEQDESHVTTKAEVVHSSHQCKFDLNEDMAGNEADCTEGLLNPFNSSVHDMCLSEPISVVAKVGVPVGLPKKPLQFDGELKWRSAGSSAFRPASLRNFDGDADCGTRKPTVSYGFDLNVTATDLELTAEYSNVDVGSKHPERSDLDLNCQSENHHGKLLSGFDLNENPLVEGTCKSNAQEGEIRLPMRHHDVVNSTKYAGGSGFQSAADGGRSSYWVDLSSMRAFNNVQAQPFLVAAPMTEQVRMVVPFQSEFSFLPQAPAGLYIGKVNGLSPTFYPPGVLPHPNNQHGAAMSPHIAGPVIAAYPGTVHVLGGPHVYSPNAYSNMRPTFVQNGSMPHLENQNRGAINTKRREPDGGWDTSQANYRWMASRN